VKVTFVRVVIQKVPFGWFNYDGTGVVYCPLEGGGDGEGRDLEVAVQEVDLAAGAVGRQPPQGEHPRPAVLETKNAASPL